MARIAALPIYSTDVNTLFVLLRLLVRVGYRTSRFNQMAIFVVRCRVLGHGFPFCFPLVVSVSGEQRKCVLSEFNLPGLPSDTVSFLLRLFQVQLSKRKSEIRGIHFSSSIT